MYVYSIVIPRIAEMALHRTVPCRTVLYCTVLYTVPYCIVPYGTVPKRIPIRCARKDYTETRVPVRPIGCLGSTVRYRFDTVREEAVSWARGYIYVAAAEI